MTTDQRIITPNKNIALPNGMDSASLKAMEKERHFGMMFESLEVIDPSKIKPTEFNILLKVHSKEDGYKGSIITPASMLEKAMFNKTHGVELMACGEECFTNSKGDYWEDRPEVGDIVITAKYAGNVYKDAEDNLYRFAHDKDIIGIISKGEK